MIKSFVLPPATLLVVLTSSPEITRALLLSRAQQFTRMYALWENSLLVSNSWLRNFF